MDIARLFGSRVRARTLQTLAATPKPLSAYRLARSVGAQPIQVLTILKSLVPAVRREKDGWVLLDDHLRDFLRSELREEDRVRRAEKDELLVGARRRPSFEHGRRRLR